MRLLFIPRQGIAVAAFVVTAIAALIWMAIEDRRVARDRGEGEIVVIGFGGSYGDAWRRAIIEPFERETGRKVRYDENCCSRLIATIDAGRFAGDLVAGLDFGGLMFLGRRGYLADDPRLAEISRRLPPRYRRPGIVITGEYAYVIAGYGPSARLPADWAEFWDRRRFPGARVLNLSGPAGQLEAALLADGVPPDRLYPLDVERALRALSRLRAGGKILFARSPSDQIALLASGNASYAIAYSNRMNTARRDGLPVTFNFRQGIRTGNGFGLLRGRHRDGVMALVEFATRPEVIARFSELSGLDRPAAGDDPLRGTIAIDSAYWGEMRATVGEAWTAWLIQ